MVKIVTDILPKETNLKIIQNLLRVNKWGFECGNGDMQNYRNILDDNVTHAGLNYCSYYVYDNAIPHITEESELNTYADIVSSIAFSKIGISKWVVKKINWNYYIKGCKAQIHEDANNKHVSLLYSLFDGDGGIEIENKLYPDKCGEAKIFPSNKLHRGVGPITNPKFRFSLNVVAEDISNN